MSIAASSLEFPIFENFKISLNNTQRKLSINFRAKAQLQIRIYIIDIFCELVLAFSKKASEGYLCFTNKKFSVMSKISKFILVTLQFSQTWFLVANIQEDIQSLFD